VSELLLLTGKDQSHADQPNSLAVGPDVNLNLNLNLETKK